MKGVDEAVEFAFDAARGVRGRDAKEAARVSLALHASRTVDATQFFDYDGALASDGRRALDEAGRGELALRVALWGADAGRTKREAASGPVGAYLKARAWAESGAKRVELGWIRDVPREAPLRGVVADRLLLMAESGGPRAANLASASLEAELAEMPSLPAFSRILRAVAVARSAEVTARTQESVGVGARSGMDAEALREGERLAAALEAERQRVTGRVVEEFAEEIAGKLKPANAAVTGAVVAAMAGFIARKGDKGKAASAAEAAAAALRAARPAAPAALAAALFVRHALPQGDAFDPLSKKGREDVSNAALVNGAAAASRALRQPGPALHALQLFDPEDHLTLISKDAAAPLLTSLVREGADAAAAANDLEALRAVLSRVRRVGLRPAWEIFVRALVVDAGAHAAAWHGSEGAWRVALDATSGSGLPAFERAKLQTRAACEFVRASEVPQNEGPWADLYFAPPARAAAPD